MSADESKAVLLIGLVLGFLFGALSCGVKTLRETKAAACGETCERGWRCGEYTCVGEGGWQR